MGLCLTSVQEASVYNCSTQCKNWVLGNEEQRFLWLFGLVDLPIFKPVDLQNRYLAFDVFSRIRIHFNELSDISIEGHIEEFIRSYHMILISKVI